VSGVGVIKEIWKYDTDPTDAAAPYTPYSFIPAGKTGIPNMSLTRDWGRRESIVSIPGADGVLDAYGRNPGPIDRRDITFGFRVIVGPGGDLDRAYDLLAAQVAPGYPQRLVYQTDAGYIRIYYVANPSYRHTTVAENKGLTAYVDFAVTWRLLKARAQFSEASERFTSTIETFDPAHTETFGVAGTTTIASPTQNFTVDARGTAGQDMPILADRGPKITITGPAGGTGGMIVRNTSALIRNVSGTLVATEFTIPFYLPTANDFVTLDFAAQTFLSSGIGPFRPTKANYQREWFRIEPGIVNTCVFIGLPAGAGLTGGKITVDWVRYFA
jgi:hypothetical protein